MPTMHVRMERGEMDRFKHVDCGLERKEQKSDNAQILKGLHSVAIEPPTKLSIAPIFIAPQDLTVQHDSETRSGERAGADLFVSKWNLIGGSGGEALQRQGTERNGTNRWDGLFWNGTDHFSGKNTLWDQTKPDWTHPSLN